MLCVFTSTNLFERVVQNAWTLPYCFTCKITTAFSCWLIGHPLRPITARSATSWRTQASSRSRASFNWSDNNSPKCKSRQPTSSASNKTLWNGCAPNNLNFVPTLRKSSIYYLQIQLGGSFVWKRTLCIRGRAEEIFNLSLKISRFFKICPTWLLPENQILTFNLQQFWAREAVFNLVIFGAAHKQSLTFVRNITGWGPTPPRCVNPSIPASVHCTDL